MSVRAALSTAYLSLGEGFADEVEPAAFPEHIARFRNLRWAERMGLSALDDAQWAAHFARFEPMPGAQPRPLALRYHGHQFGQYNPELGDGRGFLYGQLVDPVDGRLLDFGTKGSGKTPWSRGGDGRLTLKGGVREVLASEMLEALGVYTSKTWSLYETGEQLTRGDEPSPTRSSVLVRLSHGHIRFGTFQRLAFLQDADRMSKLTHYCLDALVPEADKEGEPATRLLDEVCKRTAQLAAAWTVAGFVHGVLNTDNMNITGESFDYGPWRFLPRLDLRFTAAYFDRQGMYAYGRQPAVCLWNVRQLSAALSLIGHERMPADLDKMYERAYRSALARGFVARLGLSSVGDEGDNALADATVELLAEREMGFAQFFFDWFGGVQSRERATRSPQASLYRGERFDAFLGLVGHFSAREPARLELPYFARETPCDMLIDEVEAIWAPIAAHDDWSAFESKVASIRQMGAALGLRRHTA